MKKTLLFFPIAACMLHGCSPKKNTPTQYEKLTWDNAKNNEYILARPLSFDGNPKDAYGITLDSTRWYFVATQSQCAFLPIAILDRNNISYVQEVLQQRIAKLDTVSKYLLCGYKNSTKTQQYINLEVVCFLDGYSVKSTEMYNGTLIPYTEKK